MNGLGAIACGSGLQDALNPCIFMACAVFIAHGLWLKAKSLGMGWLRVIFVLVYASGFSELNFGPAPIFILDKKFIFAAKMGYFVLSLWALVMGVLLFKDWLLMRRGMAPDGLSSPGAMARGKGNGGVVLVTVILALVLSVMSTLWPINNYIMLLGNETLLKGQWQAIVPFLAGYVVISMWPLWFVWAVLSLENLRPSFMKIFCASIFFTASSCFILVFK